MSTGEQGSRAPQPIAPAKFWLKSVLVLVVVGIVLAWVWMPSRPGEPVYQGKTVTEWLDLGLRLGRGPTGRSVCDEPIRNIGTNAIPTLLVMLAARESRIELIINNWKVRFLKNASSLSRAEAQRARGVFGFEILGERGKPALPELISLLQSRNTESQRLPIIRAIQAVEMFPIAALPEFLKIAETGEGFEQSAVNGIFSSMDAFHELTVPMLADELSSPNNEARAASAKFLGRFEHAAQAAVPSLLKALQDSDMVVREAATNALRHIDPEAAAKAGIK